MYQTLGKAANQKYSAIYTVLIRTFKHQNQWQFFNPTAYISSITDLLKGNLTPKPLATYPVAYKQFRVILKLNLYFYLILEGCPL